MTIRARHHAEVAGVSFLLLALATMYIAISGELRPVFAGALSTKWTLLAAAAFSIAGIGMLTRRLWGWYAGLLVTAGFASAGLAQLASRQRLGVATLLVATALAISVVRASPWFAREGLFARPRFVSER